MMSEKEFAKDYERELGVFREESSYINPLQVFESYYFKKGGRGNDYRKEAMERCLSERTNFSSTENNMGNIMRDFITIDCPECSKKMAYRGNNEYRCECGNKIQLYLSEFMVEFSKTPLFKVEALNRQEGETEGQVVVPIKAWFNKNDEEGKIVANVTKYNRKIGDKWLVHIDYLHGRATTDEKVEILASEIFEELRNE